MSNIINGVKGAYLQPTTYGQNESGAYTVELYEGTREEVRAKIQAVVIAGGWYEVEESYSGAKDKLTARYPLNFTTPEAPVNDWEVFVQTEVKDILESDIPVVRTLTAAQKKEIRRALDSDSTQSPALTTADQIELYLLMQSDPTIGHRVIVPTLRHTMTFSSQWVLDAALTNCEEILSTSTLLASEPTMFDAVRKQLPNRPDPIFGDGVTRRYGWLKEYPTVRIALNQRAQLVQEFVFGLWAKIQYGNPI